MGLQVWMPLNGNINNQGLSNAIVTNNGATINTAGKIGSCYAFDGNDDLISIDCSDLYSIFVGGTQEFSICCWIYQADATRAIVFGDYGLSGEIGLNIELTTAHNIRFFWNGTPDKNFSVGVGQETWTHITITYDGSQLQIYKNGTIQSDSWSGTLATRNKTSGLFYLGRDNRTGTTALNGRLNDFRIYDHALSPREVKEISKGLVLHYPLAMPGQENLQQGSDCIGSENVPGWVNNGNTTLEKIGDVIHFKRTLSNAKSVPTITMNCVTPCEFNKSYVRSMDLKFDRDIITATAAPAHFWFGARNTDNIFNTNCNGNLSKKSSTVLSPPASTIIPANTWFTQKHRFTFGDGPTSEGYDYPAIRCFVYGNVLTENYTGEVNGWMKNCKIEECEITTPWIPNPADAEYSTLGFDDGIEYDVSGYGNNGTKYGILTYSSDTPRYNTSTVFNGTDNCIKFPFNDFCTNGDIFTMNIWWKKTALGSKAYETLIGGPRGFEMDTRSGAAQALSLYMATTRGGNVYSPFNMNEWYMVTLVNDGTNELYYVNGTLVNTIEKKNMPSGNYYVGAWKNETGQNFNGFMSDFRFYKTALSANDILELYHTPISLSNNGTLLTQGEFQE